MVGRELVQEDDRRSASRLFEIEADTIFGDGMGRLRFLLVGRGQFLQLIFAAAMPKSASLRANGSRERVPDDRLREAIHLSTRGSIDCFVASLLAMTAKKCWVG
jgi:hypothetical protein